MHTDKPVRMVLYGMWCYGDRELVIKIFRIHGSGEAKLFLVAHAYGLPRLAFGLGQGRQQQGGKDGDDGDDHQ